MGEPIAVVVRLLLATVVSVLPESWRQRLGEAALPMTAGAALSALVQAAAALLVGAALFEHYRAHALTPAEATAYFERTADTGYAAHFVLGLSLYLGFFFSPAGLTCFYFFLEAIVRGAGAAAGQTVGTLPLFLLARGIAHARRRVAESRAPEPLADTVETEGDTLRIAAQTRYPWTPLTTVRYRGVLFMLDAVDERPGEARPFVHRLGPVGHRLVRKVIDYE